jgi:hypothetical protein
MQGRWYGLASAPLIGVGSVTVVRANRQGRWSCLASIPLVGVGSITVVTGQQSGGCSFLASVPLVAVVSVSVVAGRYTRALDWSRPSSCGRRRLSHCDVGPIGKGVGLVSVLQYASHYSQLIPRGTSLLLREVCVLIFKHAQIPHFLHLCFLLHVTYDMFFSSQGSLGKLNFCPATDKTPSHSAPCYSQPTPGIFCISTPHPTLSLCT